jgi:hypothetical protein
MAEDWTDRLAGARMQVDQQFATQVDGSRFSNQEWGLIMTAVEFEIEHPDDPEQARLTANTDKVADIVPELDKIQQQMGGAPGASGGSSSGGGGIFGKISDALGSLGGGGAGSGGSDDQEQLLAARKLADQYAVELQTFLEENDRWEDIRRAASE